MELALTKGRLCVAAVLLLLAVLLPVLVNPKRRFHVPPYMVHDGLHERDLLEPHMAEELLGVIKQMKDFPTVAADVGQYKTLHEHMGEAVPMGANGTCADPYMVPDSTRTVCVLAGRIDVGRHYILTGGLEGLREPAESLTPRVLSWGRYIFDLEVYPQVRGLFDHPRFLRLAKKVCPPHKQHLDPFQFNFILQLPGQTVAAHLDGVYFWGATRFQFPQWLLAAMAFSGRFVERFVDQVQVVAYVHSWDPPSRREQKSGAFVHWGSSSATPSSFEAWPRAGSAIDGSKVVHAADLYLGRNSSPPLPRIDKSRNNMLSFEGPGDIGSWVLTSDGEELQRYDTDDVRASIVYRARCFADVAEAARYGGNGGPEAEQLSLESILATLADEMLRRGVVSSTEAALALDRRALAVKIMDTFIQYPLPPLDVVAIPVNYCALPRILPAWAAPAATALLSPLCSSL